jgi:High potential iron-sulfur protein
MQKPMLEDREHIMTDRHDFKSPATRRTLLHAALCAISFLGLGTSAAYAAKASRTAVAYRDSPKGDQNCASCRLLTSPNRCESVEGVISPNGWCKIWAKA